MFGLLGRDSDRAAVRADFRLSALVAARGGNVDDGRWAIFRGAVNETNEQSRYPIVRPLITPSAWATTLLEFASFP